MAENRPPAPGFLGSLRRLGETFLAAIRGRVELFALELQQEKQWLVATLLWSAAAIFFGATAVVLVTLTILVVCPPSLRPWVLLGISALFIVLAAWALIKLRRQFQPRVPFSGSLDEMQKDLDWLRAGKPGTDPDR